MLPLKYIDKLFVVALLLFLPEMVCGQEPVDTLSAAGSQADTAGWKLPVLEGVRLGIDVSRLIGMAVDADRRFYELNTDFSFGRYLLSADVGTGRQNRFTEGLDYRTLGTYFRIGPDVNFIPDNKDNNAFFLGARYGWCTFEEQLNTIFTHTDWGSFPVYNERRTTARWFEAVAGLKARVWDNFYLGYTMRLKFGLKVNDDSSFAAYEVPGFGKVGDGNTFAFNYHIFYRIPFTR